MNGMGWTGWDGLLAITAAGFGATNLAVFSPGVVCVGFRHMGTSIYFCNNSPSNSFMFLVSAL